MALKCREIINRTDYAGREFQTDGKETEKEREEK